MIRMGIKECFQWKQKPWRMGSALQGNSKGRWNSGTSEWRADVGQDGQHRQELTWKWWNLALSCMGALGVLEIFGRPQLTMERARSASRVRRPEAIRRKYCLWLAEQYKQGGLERCFSEAPGARGRTAETQGRIFRQNVDRTGGGNGKERQMRLSEKWKT